MQEKKTGPPARSPDREAPRFNAERRAQDGGTTGARQCKGKAETMMNLLTKRDLTSRLSVSKRTIDEWVRQGRLPYCRIGATIRFNPQDIEEFLRSHTIKPDGRRTVIR